VRLHEWSGTRLVEAWCRDPRALTFSEFVDEVNRFLVLPPPIRDELDQQSQDVLDPHEQQLAALYRECRRRTEFGYGFAACFLRIEHFEGYRQRYGHAKAQRVISSLSGMLDETVRADPRSDAFVAHVGTREFVLLLTIRPTNSDDAARYHALSRLCAVFDQYVSGDAHSPEDLKTGSRALPSMKLSIGVVTNEQRTFKHFNQIAELAQEMLDYASTLPGSVFVLDKRREPERMS